MHPLPPPDSGASLSSFGVFVFEIWVLRFRDLGVFGLRFRNYRNTWQYMVIHNVTWQYIAIHGSTW